MSLKRLDVAAAALGLPEQLDNNHAGCGRLIQAAKKYPGVVQFVFEASGPYHLGLALARWEAKLALSVLNPARVRYFAKAQGKAKTDPLDKETIGAFAQALGPEPTPAPDRVGRELMELLQPREGLIQSRAAEQNRLEQSHHRLIERQIRRLVSQLTEHIEQIERHMNRLWTVVPSSKPESRDSARLKG
jgi:transposase